MASFMELVAPVLSSLVAIHELRIVRKCLCMLRTLELIMSLGHSSSITVNLWTHRSELGRCVYSPGRLPT